MRNRTTGGDTFLLLLGGETYTTSTIDFVSVYTSGGLYLYFS